MCGGGNCATRVVIVDMNAKVSGYDCHNIHMLGWTVLAVDIPQYDIS